MQYPSFTKLYYALCVVLALDTDSRLLVSYQTPQIRLPAVLATRL